MMGFKLRLAASGGNLLKVQKLVRAKEQENDARASLKQYLDSANVLGWTAIHRAAENGHLEICD
jgi:ankyrin repeat protein